jgi:hypothetical protein
MWGRLKRSMSENVMNRFVQRNSSSAPVVMRKILCTETSDCFRLHVPNEKKVTYALAAPIVRSAEAAILKDTMII